MRKLTEDLAHRLAAEHALGTLRGRARARFEAIARADPAVEAIRRRWEAAFAPLAERVPAIEPPARVWAAIERRLGPKAVAAPAAGLGFWRSFGMLAGGVAAVLMAAFLYTSAVPRAEPAAVAVLTSPTNEARMVISLQAPGTLRVYNERPWKTVQDQGRSLELWVMYREGPPRSLGIVANAPGHSVIRLRLDEALVREASAFALSSEPAGGSPTRQPTGPVLCSGAIGKARKT